MCEPYLPHSFFFPIPSVASLIAGRRIARWVTQPARFQLWQPGDEDDDDDEDPPAPSVGAAMPSENTPRDTVLSEATPGENAPSPRRRPGPGRPRGSRKRRPSKKEVRENKTVCFRESGIARHHVMFCGCHLNFVAK